MKKLIPVLFLGALLAQAQTVYRTVDESGVVSFSDTPPADGKAADEVVIDVAPPQDPEVYSQRLEDMRETTDRMAEDRRAREKHRAEMREMAARDTPRQQVQQPDLVDRYSTVWNGTGGYYYPPARPPWRPGHRPEPPIYRPPVQPQPAPEHPLQGNSQLMRPMLSR